MELIWCPLCASEGVYTALEVINEMVFLCIDCNKFFDIETLEKLEEWI